MTLDQFRLPTSSSDFNLPRPVRKGMKRREFEDALVKWGEKKARYEDSQEQERKKLTAWIKETAAAHDISDEVLYNTAEKFLQSKELQPLVAFVGTSPTFVELLYILSEASTWDRIILTARDDPRAALREILVIEAGILKASSARLAPKPHQPRRRTNPNARGPQYHPGASERPSRPE